MLPAAPLSTLLLSFSDVPPSLLPPLASLPPRRICLRAATKADLLFLLFPSFTFVLPRSDLVPFDHSFALDLSFDCVPRPAGYVIIRTLHDISIINTRAGREEKREEKEADATWISLIINSKDGMYDDVKLVQHFSMF